MSTIIGKTVLITRDFNQSKALCASVKKSGAVPIVIPMIKIVPYQSEPEHSAFLTAFEEIVWIIFTRTNGVKSFFATYSPDVFDFSTKKFAVVGKATEKCLKQYGFYATFVPSRYTGQCFIEEMAAHIFHTDRILLVKGKIARDVIPNHLEKENYVFQSVTVYDTLPNIEGIHELKQLLQEDKLDVLTFTSPSTIQSFMDALNGTALLQKKDQWTIAVIGPTSKEKAEALGLFVSIMPKEYTIEKMYQAVVRYFNK